MRLGVVILPEASWADVQRAWRHAEEMGFDHAWTYDHLTWRSFRDSAWFSAIPTLTAAATVTETIRLGTLVTSPNFRHPVPLAKELVTLDDISRGRITLGIGAGSTGWDAETLGEAAWSSEERAQRFAEFTALTDLLLRIPNASFQGRYYSAYEARTYPGCVQHSRIPFAIAASGPRGMRLAATYAQTWVTTGNRSRPGPVDAARGARDVAEQITRLEDACEQAGRDPSTLGRLVLSGLTLDSGLTSVDAFCDTVGRYREVGVTDFVVHWPRAREPYAADPSVFEAAVAALR